MPPFVVLVALVLLLSGGCSSTALSPYAAEFGEDDGLATTRSHDAGAPRAAGPVNFPTASVSPVSGPIPGALPIFPSAPPAGATPIAPSPSPFVEPWLRPERELPNCDIHGAAENCPPTSLLTTSLELVCGVEQLGQRCAYPSDDRGANLLECTLTARGALWQRRHARCSRNCWEDMPHPFAGLDYLDCSERPLVRCEDAATDQDAVDDELKRVARECALPEGMVLGLLLSPEGCGGALFIEDTGSLAKCAANALARRRFSCGSRCASSKEAGDSLLQ